MDWIGLDGYTTTAVTPRASLQSDANNIEHVFRIMLHLLRIAKLFRRPEKNEKTKVVASTPFSLSDDLKSEIDSFILINPRLIIATAGLERSDCPMRE